jgi:hypothetical protein
MKHDAAQLLVQARRRSGSRPSARILREWAHSSKGDARAAAKEEAKSKSADEESGEGGDGGKAGERGDGGKAGERGDGGKAGERGDGGKAGERGDGGKAGVAGHRASRTEVAKVCLEHKMHA